MPRPKADGQWCIKRMPGRAVWYAYRRIDGRREWRTLGTENEAQAKQTLADLEAVVESRGALTMTMLFDRYLDDRRGKVAAFSRLQEAIVPLRRSLGHLRTDQIDQRRWDRYAAERAVSAGTLRRERNVLVAALNLGDVKVKIRPPAAPPSRDRYLTRVEADRLLDAFVSPHARLLYTILLYTGCRKGQAIALTWDRVDFANNRIDFNEPDRPVTVKRRAIVPMGPKLRRAMREAHAVRTGEHVIEWAGQRATRVRHPFRQARKWAGLGPEVTPHILRHTAASWLAMARVPIDEASDLLACDPATLRRTYRKFDPAYLKRAVRALEGR